MPEAWYSEGIQAGRRPFAPTKAFVTELIPALLFTIALSSSCETSILVRAVLYHRTPPMPNAYLELSIDPQDVLHCLRGMS